VSLVVLIEMRENCVTSIEEFSTRFHPIKEIIGFAHCQTIIVDRIAISCVQNKEDLFYCQFQVTSDQTLLETGRQCSFSIFLPTQDSKNNRYLSSLVLKQFWDVSGKRRTVRVHI
jgi:hypothetical protein